MRSNRNTWTMGCALLALTSLSACGGGTTAGSGGGGGVASTPAPVAAPATPTPAPTPAPVTTSSTVNYDTAEYQRSNAAVQAKAITAYQQGATGAGVIAAVIDGGIAQTNGEFSGRIHAASTDLVSARGIGDESGHGTSVAAVLAGARNDVGAHGVAFGATLLIARTDKPGSCADASADGGCSHDDNSIARGVDLAVSNGARVINISLGGSAANATLRSAVDRATAAGVVIVISAGNAYDDDPVKGSNPDPLAMLALDGIARKSIIIAGGLDASNAALTDFSNRAGTGSSAYLGALAYRVRSIDETGTAYLYNGTSYAAPVISGAVALLAQAFPNLSGTQIVDLLLSTATDLGDTGVDGLFGHGALNIERAFQPKGQTSLAGSAIPVATSIDGGLSAPMGDARPAGLTATFLDAYGRAYSADLGETIGHSRISPRLFSALDTGMAGMRIGAGPATLSMSVRQSGSGALVERNLLSPHDRVQARALAGHAVTKLTAATSMAFGVATGSSHLQRSLSGANSTSFLIAGEADGGWGFDYAARTSMLMAHRAGNWHFYGGGESGQARRWDANLQTGALRDRQSYRVQSATAGTEWQKGNLTLSARATLMAEDKTVLGARFSAFLGSPGAQTLFADTAARLALKDGWQLSGQMRAGWTRVKAGGVRDGTDHLRTRAWALDVEKLGLLRANDRWGIRVSQPLRVSSGGFSMMLPTSYDYATRQTRSTAHSMTLAPNGRELDVETSWSMPLAQGHLGANLFWRRDPGHIAAMPDDKGAAIRFDWRF
jgi:hypothetical protein